MMDQAKSQSASLRAIVGAIAIAALGGCSLSLTPEPPASLLTLKPMTSAPSGASASAGAVDSPGAIAVFTPEVPAKLDVVRVPVTVNETEIAYLTEAVWVEKPARLFRRLLAESLRAKGPALVFNGHDNPSTTAQTLGGSLLDMGYDAQSSSVVLRFDAVRSSNAGEVIESKRFEASESGVLPEAAMVGPALNRVANEVAQDVAEWMMREPLKPAAPPIAEEATEESEPAE